MFYESIALAKNLNGGIKRSKNTETDSRHSGRNAILNSNANRGRKKVRIYARERYVKMRSDATAIKGMGIVESCA